MKKSLNIVVGLKDNQNCRGLEPKIQPIIEKGLGEDYELEALLVVYKKADFDDCINAGTVNVGIMLEKFDDIAIGQGAIKNWNTINPDVNLVLVMDNGKKGSDKAHGLYKRNYFNGLFLGDFLAPEMMKVIMYGRTQEEAYEYYGLDEYYHNREIREQQLLKENAANAKVAEARKSESVQNYGTPSKDNIANSAAVKDVSLINTSTERLPSVNTESKDALAKNTNTEMEISAGRKESKGRKDVIPKEANDKEVLAEEQANNTIGDEFKKNISNNNSDENPVESVSAVQDKEVKTFEDNSSIKIGDVDILSLQDDTLPQEPERKVISKVNDEGWSTISDNTRKVAVSGDIVRTKTKKSSSLKKIIDSINTLDKDDPYFKNIVDSAGAFLADNENQKIGYMDTYAPEYKALYKDLVDYFSYKLESELDKALTLMDNDKALEGFEASVIDYIEMQKSEYHLEGDEVRHEIFYLFERFFKLYDILTDYIDEDSISVIHVVDYNKIRVKQGMKRYSVKNVFRDEEYYERFVKNIILRNRKNIIKDGLTYSFTDRIVSDKFICNISITDGQISDTGRPEILIKKTRKEKLPLSKLINDKMTMVDASLLITAVKNGENILFVGSSFCGATTLISALLEYIPHEKNGIVIQHKDEMAGVNHPELLVQHPSSVKTQLFEDEEGDEKIKFYSVLDIAASALQLDVDYYIMSDVIGGEALSVYKALNKGYVTWANIKSNSAVGGLQSLADIIISTEPELSRDSVCSLLANKFGVIVYMERMKVVSISTLNAGGYDKQQQTFQLSEITFNNRKK